MDDFRDLSPTVPTDISTQSFTCQLCICLIATHLVKASRATVREVSHAFQLHSVLMLLTRLRTSEEKNHKMKMNIKKENSILGKDASGAIIVRVTHSCQILVDRNESPWGNPPDALGTLHAQLTCIQSTEN